MQEKLSPTTALTHTLRDLYICPHKVPCWTESSQEHKPANFVDKVISELPSSVIATILNYNTTTKNITKKEVGKVKIRDNHICSTTSKSDLQ